MRVPHYTVWGVGLIGLFVAFLMVAPKVLAATPGQSTDRPFSLQVTPSPLVATVRPGEERVLELRIRNAGTHEEHLKIGIQGFKAEDNGNVRLLDQPPKDIVSWVNFRDPVFKVQAGEWFTEKIALRVPKDVGFSYSFAIVVNRTDAPTPAPGQQILKGAVAVFTLINIDQPGAKREFTVEELSSAKRVYEYLPTTFSVKLKNTGNTIVQPEGNIFIQRSSNSQPIAVLPLNAAGSYLLPDTTRTLSMQWVNGFPSYQAKQAADNVAPEDRLVWDWSKAQDFRFGRYTAKMVAVYNDGRRDVPVTTEVTFWVIPWKLMAGALVIMAIALVGAIVIIRKLLRLTRHASRHSSHS